MLENPEKAKKADLEAEIELYREALGETGNVPALDTLSNNAAKAAVIEALRKEHGSPVRVDAAFIEENASLVKVVTDAGDTLAEGEIVFFGDEDFAQAHAADEAVIAAKEAADKVAAEAEEGKKGDEPTPPAPKKAAAAAAAATAEVDLVYQGKTVLRTVNVVAHGKLYKDVFTTDGQGYRLTPEQFDAEVTPRA